MTDAVLAVQTVGGKLDTIINCMVNHGLRLSAYKTKALCAVLSLEICTYLPTHNSLVECMDQVRNIGAIMDNFLSLSPHVNYVFLPFNDEIEAPA